jgi:fatty acid desaturase
MPLDAIAPDRSPNRIEWPTLSLVVCIHGVLMALTWFHDTPPLWLWLPVAAWFSAWWSSAQHEIVHGHPTRSRAINTALATPPYWLWLPFERYRQTHLTHHDDERLTDPLDDPESRYVTPEAWAKLLPFHRTVIQAQGTLIGRLAMGPIYAPVQFLRDEARAIADGNRTLLRVWLWHALWTALLCGWVFAICRVPLWQYLAGVVYGGCALALIRSFAEHRAHAAALQRTAIVENSRIFGLLFLYNNLHAAHHRWPAVPWYRLPAHFERNRAQLVTDNGGLLYKGYGDVFRRFLWRRHDAPVHPLGRVPVSTQRHAGNG